jgi:hypothetical protein
MLPIESFSEHSKSGLLKRLERNACTILLVAFLMLTARLLYAHGQTTRSPDPADPTEIVWRMVAQNETRAQQLKYFTSCRHYHLEFKGLGRSMAADMHVQVTYTNGSGKTFQVIDESGSHFLLNHVLRKLLETERDDSLQQKTAVTPFNYNFTFDSETNEDGRLLYIFSVEPKVKNKLLYRGKIWIDAGDYAVVRIEAKPAENPSFWIKETEIQAVYAKTGEFWLAQTNRSESKTRFGGKAELTIDYGTYQFEKPPGLTSGTDELATRKLLKNVH